VDTRSIGERFGELVSRHEPEIPIDEAALLIAAHARPSLDLAHELGRIDALADGCFAPTLDALVAYLFTDLGFAGNRLDYYDARNSYLDQVVTRRIGIPISLGILTMAVGRRLGVPLVGVGMPGHFLLRDRVDPEVFVDPFHAVHGQDAPFDETFLSPVGAVSILTRMLANLRNIFAAHSDRAGVVAVLELRNRMPGTSGEDRGELAAALAATGRFAEAATQYEQAGEQLGGSLGAEYRQNADRLRARLN
jgi:regulator of sirC expression with transglutaminase-like and TPR domain